VTGQLTWAQAEATADRIGRDSIGFADPDSAAGLAGIALAKSAALRAIRVLGHLERHDAREEDRMMRHGQEAQDRWAAWAARS
jgi:hypothetical protein